MSITGDTSIPTADSPVAPGFANAKPGRGWIRYVLNAIPNLVVFSLLAGVMYVGHHNEWRLPRMSALAGTEAAPADDWCSEHLVPESICIECQADLLPKRAPFGFCREHGVMECVIHHPELAQVKGDPQLPNYDTAAAIQLVARPENNSRNTLHTHRVQFSSLESVTKSGIDVDVVHERPMTDAIVANGELTFDPSRIAHLSSRVPGTVAFVFKTLGDDVRAGDTLALIDAAQVGLVKAQLLQALVQRQLRHLTLERLKSASVGGAIAGRAVTEAESALQESEINLISSRQAIANLGLGIPNEIDVTDPQVLSDQLRFLGIPDTVVAELPPGTSTANLIPLRAPYDGVIVASEIVAGEVVDSSSNLFTVADPTRLWLHLNIRQEDAKYVRIGLTARFKADNIGEEVTGPVSWISPSVDEQTRTLRARVVVANSGRKLLDQTFGTGHIILREEPKAIVVPREAIQSTSDVSLVFVRDKSFFNDGAPKYFHVRQVRLGASDDHSVEILAGVLPGEVVATKGSPVLLAQLLRSNLGAGCGCHEH